ncbi:MAG: PilN domain-containing protein [Candidatus Nanopelagicales bacterium]
MSAQAAEHVDQGPVPEEPGLDVLFMESTFPTPSLIPPIVRRRRAVATARRRTGLALLIVLMVLGVFYGLAQMQLSTAQNNLAVAQAELRDAEQARAQYKDVPAVYSAVRAARSELALAMGNEVQVARLVTDLSAIVPPHVSLQSMSLVTGESEDAQVSSTSVSQEDLPIATVTFAGEAVSFNDVSAWIAALRAQPDYQNVILTEVSRDTTTGTYTFTSSAELTDQTLSGRFVEETT